MKTVVHTRMLLIGMVTTLALTACHPENSSVKVKLPLSVNLVCFEFKDTVLIELVKRHIVKFYPCTIQKVMNRPIPASAFYPPRQRYRADSLLHFLKAFNTEPTGYTLGIISKDISYKKGAIKDFGLMGLGLCPGNVCVVSSYRIARSTNNTALFRERYLKTVLHELGHNFGLPHCTFSDSCYMQDAQGTLKGIDRSGFLLCHHCQAQLPWN